MVEHHVYIAGGTGYLGQRLIRELVCSGHKVVALVRKGSEAKLPPGCQFVLGNPLDRTSFAKSIPPADTFVQLVGVPHPSPAKGQQFQEIDLVSVQASVAAAVEAGIKHFVYVSVAQPASMMKAYVEVRAEGERLIRTNGLNATILRPWYILGPGHRWPYLLLPVYWLFEWFPATRASARRLGLLTLRQMIAALVSSVEDPAEGVRVLEVPQIKQNAV